MAKPTIVTRYGKGSQLTWQELDDNFSNLQNTTVTLSANGSTSDVSLGDTVTFTAGSNVTLSLVNNNLTINSLAAPYSLPVATTSVLGGVKADGTSITVAGDGTLSAAAATYTTVVKQLVKNTSGSPMYKGQPVYISSATNSSLNVSLASATYESTSSKTLGLLETDIANNGTGYVITEGRLSGINTSTAVDGDSVWLSTTAGALVYGYANRPTAPNHMVYIGVVGNSANSGEILVKIANGVEIGELHDVALTSPVAGDYLKYDAVTDLWKNSPLQTASTSVAGVVKVDGTTITITNGIISSSGGGGGTTAAVGFEASFLLGGL